MKAWNAYSRKRLLCNLRDNRINTEAKGKSELPRPNDVITVPEHHWSIYQSRGTTGSQTVMHAAGNFVHRMNPSVTSVLRYSC